MGVTDWSEEQLKKHVDELQSYVGNFLLRATSDRMAAQIAGTELRTVDAVFADSSFDNSLNREVIAAQRALAGRVGECLKGMEVAEGLQYIVDLLKQVG